MSTFSITLDIPRVYFWYSIIFLGVCTYGFDGKKIKELRNKYKYTQTELAAIVGVTKSTIAAYENDSRQPSYEVLIKLSTVFNVSTDSLLLPRTENILDVTGLSSEQLSILNNLISYFKKLSINQL